MPTRLIDLPFTAGLNEAVDETVAQLPTMTELTNYRLTRAGRLEHRLGVKEVSVTAAINTGTGATPDNNNAQAIYGRTLVAGAHAYSATGLGGWVCNGSVSRYVPYDSFSGLTESATSYTNPSCASAFGYLVVIGANNDDISLIDVRIFDEATGSQVWDDQVGVVTGASPNNRGRTVACGNTAVIVFQNIDTGNIYGTSMDLSTLPFTAFPAETVIIGSSVSYGFDAAAVDSSTYVIAHYISGTGRVELRRLDATTHTPIAAVSLATGTSYATCLYYAGVYYLAWTDTSANTVSVALFNGGLVQIGSTQTVATGLTAYFRPVLVGNGTSNGVFIGWSDSNGSTYRVTFRAVSSAAVLGLTYGPVNGHVLASKPFLSSATFASGQYQPSVWLSNYNPNSSETDRSYFLVTLPIGTVTFSGAHSGTRPPLEMSASPSAAARELTVLDQLPEVVESTGPMQNIWQTTLLEGFRGLGTVTPQSRVQVYRFGDASRSLRARTRAVIPCQSSFAVLGGAPRYFDGSWMTEIGIPHGPAVLTATPDTGGSMTANATYRYVFVIDYYDAKGQRQLSYVSNPYSVTMGALDGEVFFDIAVPAVWAASNAFQVSDPRSVALRAYRTAADVGTVFRYAPAQSSPNGKAAGPYSSVITYIDDNSDAAIAANEAIYVQVGNALSNYRAPPCRFGCEHEGRLVVAGTWNPNEARVSKLFFPGEGIQFTESAAFIITNPEPITGCASLDGSLVLFGERSIYTVSGDGPTDDGAGSFTSPRKLPGRIGCVDWRSVATREDGVFFRGADGIYMLPRGLASPVFIGASIREKLREYPETLGVATATRAVSASVDDHDSEQVVAWLVGDAESPTSVAIFVLSLSTNAWTQFVLPEASGNLQVVIGTWFDFLGGSDVLGFVRHDITSATAGSVLIENVGSGYDQDISGSFEPLLAGGWKTGKLFPFGFGGRGSVRTIRLVGECLAATTLTPTVWSDADAAGYVSDTLTFTPGRFAVEIPFRRRDLAWVQIQVADPVTGSENRGAGLRFNGLALEVEMEGGLHRTTPNERST